MRHAAVSILVSLAFAAAALAGEPPQQFTDRNGWLGVQLEQQPLPEGGIRITQVVAGAPAARGSLRDGDVILAIGGEAVDSLATLVRLIAGTEPGTAKEFEIRRGDKTFTLSVTVGHRRESLGFMTEGGRTAFPSNAELHPEWEGEKDPLADLVAGLLAKAGQGDIPGDLVAAFARDEELLQTFYKLNEVSSVRRDPFKLPRSARSLTDALAAAAAVEGLPALVGRAAAALDTPLPAAPADPADSPAAVVEALALAQGLVERAFRNLSGGERSLLRHQSWPLFDKFKEHIYIAEGSSETLYRNNLEAIRLSKRIDYASLFLAALAAARAARGAAALPAASWATPPPDWKAADAAPFASGDVAGAFETPAGMVILGGRGRTVYTGDAALIVDTGGDDVYLNRAGSSGPGLPVALLVDLEGDDSYRGTRACQGAGWLGVGILVDLAGDDRYDGSDVCQGASLFGVGLLLDAGGHDRYAADAYHAGAGLFGIGILADLGGDDGYSARLYSQGFGATKGFGLLLDARGDDAYYASGKFPSSYGTPAVYRGMSQGFGIGFRQIAAGGMGVLLDLAGNDHYVAGNFSQGGGYFLGYGILRDRAGDDRYDASRYNQGFGVHSAVGILLDDAGNDRYRSEVAANQGSAWDLGVGWLVDGGGNDRYEAHGLAQGGSSQNGFSVLLDLGGTDDYFARGNAQGFGGDTSYGGGRGARNLGILVDAGGSKDAYNRQGRADGRSWADAKGGVFADLPGPIEEGPGQEPQVPGKHEGEPGEEEKGF